MSELLSQDYKSKTKIYILILLLKHYSQSNVKTFNIARQNFFLFSKAK